MFLSWPTLLWSSGLFTQQEKQSNTGEIAQGKGKKKHEMSNANEFFTKLLCHNKTDKKLFLLEEK